MSLAWQCWVCRLVRRLLWRVALALGLMPLGPLRAMLVPLSTYEILYIFVGIYRYSIQKAIYNSPAPGYCGAGCPRVAPGYPPMPAPPGGGATGADPG